jgi:tetratricopeptide (TPR) repeat protein
MEWLGQWDECLQAAVEAEEIGGAELLHAPWFTNRWVSPVAILCHRGEIAQARALAERLAPSLVSDQPDTVIMNAALLANVLHAEGAHREALDHLLPLWRESPPKHTHPAGKVAWGLIIECAFALGDLALVREMLEPILALRAGQTPPSLDAQRLRYGALLDEAEGRHDGVEQRLSSAIDILRGADMPFHEAVTRLELAECLVARNERERARQHLAAARTIFERLKARPSLERLLKAEAS